MKNRVILYPYKVASNSTLELQRAINNSNILPRPTMRVKPDGAYIPRNTDVIVNWGNSNAPSTWSLHNQTVLNHPVHVAMAANKLNTFEALNEVRIKTPEYTTDIQEASVWLRDGFTIIERHTLTGHSGAGIRIVRPLERAYEIGEGNMLSPCPLYVQYKKKRSEYRVHVFNGTVLFVQEKRRERERERTADESLIRSHQNGWVFCRTDIIYPTIHHESALHHLARSAVTALGLDFGAVDIIYNERENTYYVLEINTAPGLEGQSIEDYKNAILNYIEELNGNAQS